MLRLRRVAAASEIRQRDAENTSKMCAARLAKTVQLRGETIGLRCASRVSRGFCAFWQCDRAACVWRCNFVAMRAHKSGTALRGNVVATPGRCKVALSSVQIEVNVGVRVSKTLRATTQRNDLHVLCPSDACVQNGIKKKRRKIRQLSVS